MLYVLLLLKHARQPGHQLQEEARESLYFPSELPSGERFAWRPVSSQLKDSFVCEACDSLLNYGVTECNECGERYRYRDGKPSTEADDT